MSTSERTGQGSPNIALVRDPKRPPGLALVIVAFIALLALGYVIYPAHRGAEVSAVGGGGDPSAATDAGGGSQAQ